MKAASLTVLKGASGEPLRQDSRTVGPRMLVAGGESQCRAARPEKRLMLAVLDEAVHTFRTHMGAHRPGKRRVLAQVQAWFESEDNAWPFSFLNICESLDLDAGRIRQALSNYREAHHRERAVIAQQPDEPTSMWPEGREPGLFRWAL